MKKNISINISGIIFHIEEDGYDMLRKYLDSVNRYFSTFDDNAEILADIEGRMAEIFLTKLSDTKQIITQEDVNTLISVMGSVSDFKAAEENEFANEPGTPSAGIPPTSTAYSSDRGQQSNTSSSKSSTPKRLYRDQKRKILGGVCAGLANYFNIDAVWVRLIFALLLFAYGAAVIVYFALWIAVPGSFELEDGLDTKKMYRDPERKVVGGVAAGVAAYFGTDVVLIRILLLISIFFFGTGFLLYIILWIVLPEAKSMTERMQMQGEPVTLSNIESNIKKNIQEDSNKEENLLTKILLLPFRVAAAILTLVGKILVPMVDVLRVASGVFLTFLAIVFILVFILTGGVFLGLFTNLPSWIYSSGPNNLSFPLEAITNAFPPLAIVIAMVAILIPIIVLLLLGISIVAKRLVFGAVAGWSLLVLFFVSIVLLSILLPRVIYSFKESGERKIETYYTPNGKTAILTLQQTGLDDYHATKLTLKGHDSKEFKLIQRFQAQGASVIEAVENSKMVEYSVTVNDSVFTFDSNLQFKDKAVFRGQELEMTLFIPYDFPFVMDKEMCRFISQYVAWEEVNNNTWVMTSKGLQCMTCDNSQSENAANDWSFDKIELQGFVEATITESDEFSVELVGNNEEKANYSIEQSGKTLVIKYRNFDEGKHLNWDKNIKLFDEVELKITMPSLEKITAKGAGKVSFFNFVSDDLEINLLGAFKGRGDITAHNLLVDMKGASELELVGEGNNFEASITGASRLKAYDFATQDAIIETVGVSSARVNVSGLLEMKEGIGSSISYRGNPSEVKKIK
jgi:phage shock protein PspC (stress-responsive transcriptional regulator)